MIIEPSNRAQKVSEYYFSKKLKEVRALLRHGNVVYNLAVGSPDLPPEESIIDHLNLASKVHSNHGYQPYSGLPVLREAIAEFTKDYYEVEVDPDNQVLPLMGSKEGITHISLAFLNPGDVVLVPELGYPAYRSVSTMVEAEVHSYPLKENKDGHWYPDFSNFDKELLDKCKLFWINYPHMPTGTPADSKVFKKLFKLAKKHKFLVVHDNPYSLVLNQQEPFSIFQLGETAWEHGLELNSLSKSHNLAGWRVGWVTGKSSYLQETLKMKSNVDSGMFAGIQYAASEALRLPREWHEKRNAIYKGRLELAQEILTQLGCSIPEKQEGMFLWGKLDEGIDVESMVDQLLYERHVFVTPGFIFGEKGKNYLRISLCNPTSIMDKAKQRLAGFQFQPDGKWMENL